MKNLCLYIVVVLLFVQKETVAQKNEDSLFVKYVQRLKNKQSHYYIVTSKTSLLSSFQIIRQLNDSVSIVSLGHQNSLDSLIFQTKIIAANNEWKSSPSLEKWLLKNKGEEQKFILTALNVDALLGILSNRSDNKLRIISIDRPSKSVVIKCDSKYLKESLLELDEVIFADLCKEAIPETAIIGYDRTFHGINALDYLIPNANGKNIVAGVKEQKMDEADIDLWKRVLPSAISAPTTSFHATTIASIIGGAGNSFYWGRGIAPGCLFFPSSFSNLFADDSSVLKANKVSVQNHSYGTAIQQFYGAEAVSYDVLTWNDKTYVPVFSSGNQGDGFATEGKYVNLAGYANLTGNFKMAKNIITVGAIDDKENIPLLSSAGPTFDGRLAPQLTALGPSGTSDAAAMVSGTVAVIQQVYADSNHLLPPASLVKAILYNTADDIYKPGIDYKTGYGLLNSYVAVKSIQQKFYDGGVLSTGQQWTKSISVPANAAELKVTLAWTDTAATVNTNKALINDLDLEVTQLNSGIVYQPWVLSNAANIDSLGKLPIRKRDSLNASEQVSIHLPSAGNYQVKVKAKSVTSSIPFHIAYKLDTLNTFMFTSPLHASDVSASNNRILSIRWRTFVADTNQMGSLYISYDGGGSWKVLSQAVKLVSKKFNWPVKDTNSTALLKMETSFGNFLSNSFVISKLTTVQVDFNCADSFRLSWNKHAYANAYKVYALTDSPYLKQILSITDTFLVLKKATYPFLIYAVEPVLTINLPEARSVAVNIETLGVKCFYKSLNYDLLDTNKLKLILELSTISNVDSVLFEKVSASGQLLQTYGGVQVTNNQTYTFLVNQVAGGVTYVRGKIKLKNGAIVYTDIIPVLTSGKKSIWFYPNPVSRSAVIKYVLQQGVPPYSALQLFDVYGRLIKNYSSLPNAINASELPAGVIIYRLLNDQNETLETGKLIIQ